MNRPANQPPYPNMIAGPDGTPIPVAEGTVALDSNGLPIGSTGGWIPEQQSERDARLAALDAAAQQALASAPRRADLPDGAAQPDYQNGVELPAAGQDPRATPAGTPLYGTRTAPTGPRAGAPLVSPTQRTLTPQNMPEPGLPGAPRARTTSSLAMSQLLGVNAPLPGAGGGRNRYAGSGYSALDNAMALEALARNLEADREAGLLEASGNSAPSAQDTPEVRARKLNYLRTRILNDAAGIPNRAPTTPVYMGDVPQSSAVTRERAVQDKSEAAMLADLGQYAMLQRDLPRMITVGYDANNKPIKRIYNPKTGNTEDPADSAKQTPKTEITRLLDERDAAIAANDTERVKVLDRVIANTKAGDVEKPATVTEFMGDPRFLMLRSQFGNDYGAYLRAYREQAAKAQVGDAAAPSGSTAPNKAGDQRAAAMDWLAKNPNHPRAAAVRARLGITQ